MSERQKKRLLLGEKEWEGEMKEEEKQKDKGEKK